MSKKRFENDQNVPGVSVAGDTKVEAVGATATPPAASVVSLSIPLGTVREDEYCSSHYQLNILRQNGLRRAMKRLHNGLVSSEERMADGHRVVTLADTLRWLVEQVAKAGGEDLPH